MTAWSLHWLSDHWVRQIYQPFSHEGSWGVDINVAVTVSVTCVFCTVKHRPILKCGKNAASMLIKTQATSSTSEFRVTVRTGNYHRLSPALMGTQRKWRCLTCLKGAVLNIEFGPFYVFSRVFFTPLRYDYPFDATLLLWQFESCIRGGLLYYKFRMHMENLGNM